MRRGGTDVVRFRASPMGRQSGRGRAFLLSAGFALAATSAIAQDIPSVPHTNALKATPTTQFKAGVYRMGFATPGDTTALFYTPSNVACTLGAGLGDNGSQIPSLDGKCWLAVFPASGIDIRWFGADRTGAADSLAAILAAATSFGSADIILHIPRGNFRLTAALTITLTSASQHITIKGEGNGSIFNWPQAAGGIAINYIGQNNTATIRDVSLTTTGTGSATALSINQTAVSIPNPANTPLTLIENIQIHGTDGFGLSNYWTTGINLSGVSTIDVISSSITGPSTFLGNGIIYGGGTATRFPVVLNMRGLSLNSLGNGLYLDTYTQGINFLGSNCTNTQICINSVGSSYTDQFVIADSQFNATVAAFRGLPPPDMIVHDNLFIIGAANAVGLDITGTVLRLDVHDNNFIGYATGTIGIRDTAALTIPSMIHHNVFSNLAVGIHFPTAATVYDVQIEGNQYIVGGNTVVAGVALGAGSTTLAADLFLNFANMIACNVAHRGRHQDVGDSNTNVWGANIAGGGANGVRGFCDGANWTVMGK